MKSRAVRIHGKNDLRLDEFELPPLKDDEILVKIVSDSVCMSTYKMAIQGTEHKRVHADVAEHPAICGHEFAGDIVEVGSKWAGKYEVGAKFTIQPNMQNGEPWSPGYSYEFCGGDSTYCILPAELLERGCLLEYSGDAYYKASVTEPMSCNIGAFHASFHTKPGVYVHDMGIVKGGKLALIAAAGPMGLGGLTYALHCDHKPSLIVLSDISEDRLARARELFPADEVKDKYGVELHIVNNGEVDDPVEFLRGFTGGTGFNDVFCYAPVAPVVTLSDAILGNDGCLNFFAGPVDHHFTAPMNFYNVHYEATHVIGTSGGNTEDMKESLALTAKGMDPSVMITHVGGLNAAAETTLNLPKIPGGKKLIYTHIDMPLTAIEDFRAKAAEDERFGVLADLTEKNNGLWSPEAEKYLLEHWKQN
ncbi:MAG: zinc-binding dehydrogenase [Atopobiaceae bacterium]|jgi:threonine dehydrogenase-like Zn-dependent dehydrogenase|nr:zinc-binding dehydrogenase [Atopobiaceae bacterium]MCH4120412.1 zinc-binding dehydrogenase [Atopobiaceae bacterium]MCI1389690.1 zinc-binding dehydrogenase [Atopobiaceae bacterium]MCI1431908.1 zinc-binding dehydrogenase [Atopobiaceae bacterium]MCI1470344.1 zinc-binding dehydrogenase [Atopobiaceae bacterium]